VSHGFRKLAKVGFEWNGRWPAWFSFSVIVFVMIFPFFSPLVECD